MPVKDVILAVLVALIWGCSFPVVKVGLSELPPLLFSALRFAFVALAISFVPFPRGVGWRDVALVGLLLGVAKFGLLFAALASDVSAGSAALLLQSQVFFTLALGAIFFGEKLMAQQRAGVGLALVGVALFLAAEGGSQLSTGMVFVFGAALSWALVNIIMKRMESVDLLRLMVWASLFPIIPLLALSAWIETPRPWAIVSALSVGGWLTVVYMAVLSTLVAYALWGTLLVRHHSVRVAPFALLIPLVAIAVSARTLGEAMSWGEWLGLAAILSGIAFCVFARSEDSAGLTDKADCVRV